MFLRLQAGEKLTAKKLMEDYGISKSAIYRDLQELRLTLAEVSYIGNELVKVGNSYVLSNAPIMKEEYIYAIGKILLESRALNRAEMTEIFDGLHDTVSSGQKLWLKKSILSEMTNYQSVSNPKNRLDLLYSLENAIQNQQMVSFEYEDNDAELDLQAQNYHVLPKFVFFDNFYFYLEAEFDGKKKIFHINFISDLKIDHEKHKIMKPASQPASQCATKPILLIRLMRKSCSSLNGVHIWNI